MEAVPLPLGKREQTKTRNRAVLLAAAHDVFARLGFDAATVRDILRGTDLSVGTFYQYFRDKQEIFAAVVDEVNGALRARLRAKRRNQRRSFEQRIEDAYLAFFTFVAEERPLYEIIRRNQSHIAPTAERGVALALRELGEDIALDLKGGALAHEAPDLVAAAMIGMGLMVAQRLAPEGPLSPEEAARFCTRLSLRGLAPAQRRKSA